MAKNSRLEGLRAEALKAQRAVGNKISRLKSKKGVKVAGTHFDPRVDKEKISRMTSRQAEAHIRKLNKFTDRKTQFEPGVYGRPLRAETFAKFKKEEEKRNASAMAMFNKYANTFLPHKQRTLAQLADIHIPKRGTLRSGQNNFAPTDRKSKGFVSEKKLQEALKDLRRKHGPKWDRERAADIRENIHKLSEFSTKHDALMALINGFTDEDGNKVPGVSDIQLIGMWDLGGLADALVNPYGQAMLLNEGDSNIEFSEYEENLDEAFEILDWAQKTGTFRRRL